MASPPSSSPGVGPTAPKLESLAVEPLMTRDFETQPALVYERLRARYGPVAPVTVFDVPVWLVLGFREVLDVLGDESRWRKDISHWRGLQEGRVPADWPMLASHQVSHLLSQDGRQREITRAAVDAALRPFQDPRQRQGRELMSAVILCVDELIAYFSDRSESGWMDLSAQFSRPLPLMVINRLFGFPVEQGDDIFMDAWRMMDAGPDASEAVKRLLSATTELAAYKRTHPGDDLTSRLLAGDALLSVEQVGRELYGMLVVMSDLTSHSITNAVLEVVTGKSDARADLSAGLVDDLVNRVHIASPPWTNLSFRYPAADTYLGGFTLAAGDPVMPSIVAAHGDPLFVKLLTDDYATMSRSHLAWGAGPHQCPGRELAEMMVTAAVNRLFERCDLELGLPLDQLPRRSSAYVRGMRSLPMRFRARVASNDEQAPAAEPPEGPGMPGDGEQPDGSRSSVGRFVSGLRKGVPVIGDGMVH